MGARDGSAWRLLEAVEILHAHGDGSFGDRLDASTRHLFHGSTYALDIFAPDGSHPVWHNIPFDRNAAEVVRERGAEIVLRDHPFARSMLDGELGVRRLSDKVSMRSFRETELFRTLYRPFGVKFQTVAALSRPLGHSTLTVNRDNTDFSDDEVESIRRFARHVEHAYGTELLLSEGRRDAQDAQPRLRERLARRRVTPRESTVLYWLTRGKSNAEIAFLLGLSVRTVEVHLANSYRKLGVDSRNAALVAIAGLR